MKIEYSNGSGQKVANENKAREYILANYPYAIFGDWEQGRMLVWQDGDNANNDDGQKALAQIMKNSKEQE